MASSSMNILTQDSNPSISLDKDNQNKRIETDTFPDTFLIKILQFV